MAAVPAELARLRPGAGRDLPGNRGGGARRPGPGAGPGLSPCRSDRPLFYGRSLPGRGGTVPPGTGVPRPRPGHGAGGGGASSARVAAPSRDSGRRGRVVRDESGAAGHHRHQRVPDVFPQASAARPERDSPADAVLDSGGAGGAVPDVSPPLPDAHHGH